MAKTSSSNRQEIIWKGNLKYQEGITSTVSFLKMGEHNRLSSPLGSSKLCLNKNDNTARCGSEHI